MKKIGVMLITILLLVGFMSQYALASQVEKSSEGIVVFEKKDFDLSKAIGSFFKPMVVVLSKKQIGKGETILMSGYVLARSDCDNAYFGIFAWDQGTNYYKTIVLSKIGDGNIKAWESVDFSENIYTSGSFYEEGHDYSLLAGIYCVGSGAGKIPLSDVGYTSANIGYDFNSFTITEPSHECEHDGLYGLQWCEGDERHYQVCQNYEWVEKIKDCPYGCYEVNNNAYCKSAPATTTTTSYTPTTQQTTTTTMQTTTTQQTTTTTYSPWTTTTTIGGGGSQIDSTYLIIGGIVSILIVTLGIGLVMRKKKRRR